MSTSTGLQSASLSFDMSLYIGTQRIENFLGRDWRDVSGASQGIKDYAREMALRNHGFIEKYGDWKPLLMRHSFTISNPKQFNYGTILGFDYGDVVIKPRRKVTSTKGPKTPKTSGGGGNKKAFGPGRQHVGSLRNVVNHNKGAGHNNALSFNPNWTTVMYKGAAVPQKGLRYRCEAEPFVGYTMPYSTSCGNLNPNYILQLTGHQSSQPGVGLAIRKAMRLERNARRAANRAAFGALPFKAAKRAVKAANRAARTTWNVVKLINSATRKALDFMREARANYGVVDVNGNSSTLFWQLDDQHNQLDVEHNKEEQAGLKTAEDSAVQNNLKDIITGKGGVLLHTMQNQNWDGKHNNVFIAICAGQYEANTKVNYNYPLLTGNGISSNMVITYSPTDPYPSGCFMRPDFVEDNQSMAAYVRVAYVPLRTRCYHLDEDNTRLNWKDLVAFNCMVPDHQITTAQYQLAYNSYYAEGKFDEDGAYSQWYKSDYGTSKLKDIPAAVGVVRQALHNVLFNSGGFLLENNLRVLNDHGNKVVINQSVQDWIRNNIITNYMVDGEIVRYPVPCGYFLVVGYVNDLTKGLMSHVKKAVTGPTGETLSNGAAHTRVLCDKVEVYGIRYDLLSKFVDHNLREKHPVSKHYWRMPFFPWAHNALKGQYLGKTQDNLSTDIVPAVVEPSITPAAETLDVSIQDLLSRIMSKIPTVTELPEVAEVTQEEGNKAELAPETTTKVEVVADNAVVAYDTERAKKIAAEVVAYLVKAPKTVKQRYASEEELQALCDGFKYRDDSPKLFGEAMKSVYSNMSGKTLTEILQSHAVKAVYHFVHAYYYKLTGAKVELGATYAGQFIIADLVRLVDTMRALLANVTNTSNGVSLGIDYYLTLTEVNAKCYVLKVDSQHFTLCYSSGEWLVYDSRNRVFNRSIVLRCIRKGTADYTVCSSLDNFMRFFLMGIVHTLVNCEAPYLPTAWGDNVKVMLNNIASMSTDEIDTRNSSEVYLQQVSYQFDVWTEHNVNYAPSLKNNAKEILKSYKNPTKTLDFYYDPKRVNMPINEMLQIVAANLHRKEDTTIHFSKYTGISGSITAINLGRLRSFAPTVFAGLAAKLGWAEDTLDSHTSKEIILCSIKAAKGAKRITNSLTTAATMSRTGQLVKASYRFPKQMEALVGLLSEIVLAPTLVMQPGMIPYLNKIEEVANIYFNKEEYILEGNYTINEDTKHPFLFDSINSTVEGIKHCEWSRTTDAKGWNILTPDRELQLEGGELICRTMPKTPLPLDGRGKIQHPEGIAGTLVHIKWRVEQDMLAASKLHVVYVVMRDLTEFKLRNVFLKANEVVTRSDLFFNELNGNADNQYPVRIITQDAAKLDVVFWVMSLICDTVGNPANRDWDNPVFVKLHDLLQEYVRHTGLTWDATKGEAVCLIPWLIVSGYTDKLVAYFNSVFSKVSWFVWPQSAPMANMLYKLYSPRVAVGNKGWYPVTDTTVWNAARSIQCEYDCDELVVYADSQIITDKTNILVFWLKDGVAVKVAQRCMTWVSAQGIKLSSVMLVELSSILENVNQTNTMLMSIAAISALVKDKARRNAIQHAAVDKSQGSNYRVAALAHMVGGGTFGLSHVINITVNANEQLVMDEAARAVWWPKLQAVAKKSEARQKGSFEEACEVLKHVCFHVTYKGGEFSAWAPALFMFNKLQASNKQANNFVDCFYYDILLPLLQGVVVPAAVANSCHGMMRSLLRSEDFLALFQGPRAAGGKRISTPEIPMGEMWILRSEKAGSEYLNFKKAGIDLSVFDTTSLAPDAEDVIIYRNRAPLALGAFLKVRLIYEAYKDIVTIDEEGNNVVTTVVEQYALPIPSDAPEQTEYWKTTPLAYHMTYTQIGESCDAVYASDLGDNDGDPVGAAKLKHVAQEDVCAEETMLEIQQEYIGMDAYSVDNTQYIADHFGIKKWDDVMVFVENLPKAINKALTTYDKYASQSAYAVHIIKTGVGIEYRIYATCDVLVNILVAFKENGYAVHSNYQLLLDHKPTTLVLNTAQAYEYTLGGYSEEAQDLYVNYLKPILDGKLDSTELESSDGLEKLGKVLKKIGISPDRTHQIARMMNIICTIYIYKTTGVYNGFAFDPEDSESMNEKSLDLLLASHAIFEMSRNKFCGYGEILPNYEVKSVHTPDLDKDALRSLMNLLRFCSDKPQVIEDSIYLYSASQTVQVLYHEMVGNDAKSVVWEDWKLQGLAKESRISLEGVELVTGQVKPAEPEVELVYIPKTSSELYALMQVLNLTCQNQLAKALMVYMQKYGTEPKTDADFVNLVNLCFESAQDNKRIYLVDDFTDEGEGNAPAVPEPKTPSGDEGTTVDSNDRVPDSWEEYLANAKEADLFVYDDRVELDGKPFKALDDDLSEPWIYQEEPMVIFIFKGCEQDEQVAEDLTVGFLQEGVKLNEVTVYTGNKVRVYDDEPEEDNKPHTMLINDNSLATQALKGEAPSSVIYLGRNARSYPCNYGNPYSDNPTAKDSIIVGSNKEAVEFFAEWLYGARDIEHKQDQRTWIVQQLQAGALKGKTIVCYHHGGNCHGDVLLGIAKGEYNMPPLEVTKPAVQVVAEQTSKPQPGNVLVKEPGLFAQQNLLAVSKATLSKVVEDLFNNGYKAKLGAKSYEYTCCGSYFWTWNAGKGKYITTQPDGTAIQPIPEQLAKVTMLVLKRALEAFGDQYQQLLAEFEPQAVLINKYEAGQSLNSHVDKDEQNLTAPIVSLSFGATGIFEIASRRLELDDGAVCVFWDKYRLAKHAYLGNTTEGTRYNVTVRMVTKPGQAVEPTVEEVDSILPNQANVRAATQVKDSAEQSATEKDKEDMKEQTVYYTGIGSRGVGNPKAVPTHIVEMIERIAVYKGSKGHVLRSGSADGCDTHFENGAKASGGQFVSYLPWPGFNGRNGSNYVSEYDPKLWETAQAVLREVIGESHYNNLGPAALALHTRNVFQVLGDDLQTPSKQVICWTTEGKTVGGTATAIKLAERCGITVINLGNPEVYDKMKAFLDEQDSKQSTAQAPAVEVEANTELHVEEEEAVEVTYGQIRTANLITSKMVDENPNTYFVFGDNFERVGKGGQAAVMRGKPNSIGIATKMKPAKTPDAYLKDDLHYELFQNELTEKLNLIVDLLTKGHDVVFPSVGIGTGYAEMQTRAPKCWELLKSCMQHWGLPGYDDSEPTVELLSEEDFFTEYKALAYRRGKDVDLDFVQDKIDSLNEEQKQVIFRFFLSDKDMFLTGEGGAGKTYTTCTLRSLLDAISYPYYHLGTTGISVMNVDGHGTINSVLGLMTGMTIHTVEKGRKIRRDLQKGEYYATSDYDKLVMRCVMHLEKSWQDVVTAANGMPVVLFLEECSMLGSLTASAVDEALKSCNVKVKWFMGGDLCQFAPVKEFRLFEEGELYDKDKNEVIKRQAIFNNTRFEFLNLLSNMRAQGHDEWIEALRVLRFGIGSIQGTLPLALRKVWQKSVEAYKNGTLPIDNAVHLCATNYTATLINNQKIEELKRSNPLSQTFNAIISVKPTADPDWYKGLFNPIEDSMWFCVGMRVMLRSNQYEGKKLMAGNGSCGVVTDFVDDYEGKGIEVLFDNGVKRIIRQEKWGKGSYDYLGVYIQVPLHPCYAMTVNKSQGLTLEGNVIFHPYMQTRKNGVEKVTHIWSQNSMYVMASRCPKPDNLYVMPYIPGVADVYDTEGNYDYDSAYRYFARSYVCDFKSADFVRKYVIKSK